MVHHLFDRLGHEAAIYAFAYDQTRSVVYSADGNGWIVKWSSSADDDNGILVARAEVSIFCLQILSHTNTLLAGDLHGYIHVIDIDALTIKRRILAHPKGVFAMLIKDEYLYSIGADGKVAKWDCTTMELILQNNISKVGLRSMIEDKGHFYLGDGAGYIYKLDDQLQPIFSWPAHKTTVFALAVHGDKLISGGRDAMLSIWGRSSQDLIRQEAAHWYAINKVIIIGDIIITLSRDKKIRLWNSDNLSLIQSFDVINKGHIRSVNTGIWLEDKNELWTAGDDKVVKVWGSIV